MNRKTIFIGITLLVIALAIVIYLFWPKPKTEIVSTPPFDTCLVFQSDDIGKPCYMAPKTPTTPSVGTGSTIIIPSRTGTTSSPLVMPSECTNSISVFERDDCVTKKAVASKNTQLCTLVSGSLSQSACVKNVNGPTALTIPVQNQSYDAFLRSVSSVLPTTIQNIVTSAPSALNKITVSTSTDSRFTAEGFVERYASTQTLTVFALSRYQARPGDTVILYGAGFVYPTSIHVGSSEISGLKSDDGVSLPFVAPSASGEYDIWVTNSKGSSLSAYPAARLLITDNPLPAPQVMSVTPVNPTPNDTITISGSGFSEDNTLSTTLGLLEHVGASGNVIQVRISDLPIVSQIRDLKEVKGKKFAVGVYVGNKAGFNPTPFYFDVQF